MATKLQIKIEAAAGERLASLGHGIILPGTINDGSLICTDCELAVTDIMENDLSCFNRKGSSSLITPSPEPEAAPTTPDDAPHPSGPRLNGSKFDAEELLILERSDHACQRSELAFDLAEANLREARRTAAVMNAQFEVTCKKLGIDPARSFSISDDRTFSYDGPESEPTSDEASLNDLIARRAAEARTKGK